MATLRADISISELNERSSEYLPGYLGIEILELAPNTLHSRMPIKKLHFAPNDFLHAASVVALADTSCGDDCSFAGRGPVLHHHRVEKQSYGDSERGQHCLCSYRTAPWAEYASLGCGGD